MIHVLATIQLNSGTRDAFLAEFHKLMPHVHAESGCIEYGPAIDIASPISVQDPVRENVVTVIEKWESIEALQSHLGAIHMAEYRMKVKNFVSGVRLQILQPA